jgi:hypothetical protein
MAKSLRAKFSKNIHVDEDALKVLTEQFRDLSEKVKAGDYVVTAKEQSSPGDGHNTIDSVLDVVIKPSAQNSASSIQSMTFKFDHDGYQGTTYINFKIKTKDGKTLSGSHYGHVLGLLEEAQKLGLEKVAQAEYAPQRKAIEAIKNIKL